MVSAYFRHLKFSFFRFLQKQKCCHFPIILDWNYDLGVRNFVLLRQRKSKRFSFFFRARKTKPFSFYPRKENARFIHAKKTLVLSTLRKRKILNFYRAKKAKPFSFCWAKKTKIVFSFYSGKGNQTILVFGERNPNHTYEGRTYVVRGDVIITYQPRAPHCRPHSHKLLINLFQMPS